MKRPRTTNGFTADSLPAGYPFSTHPLGGQGLELDPRGRPMKYRTKDRPIPEQLDDWDAYEHQPAQRHGLLDPPSYVSDCACGGEIVVTRNLELDIQSAVLTHAETPQHKAWRERQP